ncbi:iron-containing alcohol dehydrogenase [Roseibacterium sp. SDUM158017]|uniref:iron-containing alcohol dehydrogenase n=1 Tax=Roseicyclus salinarum TaxID=3036773 RepID=UPI0024154B66|nr:iron-containing alcohol dehydrogenase [Roseibacterium sp. SDUM158017]MDG4648178.1 iron-containing alcohol dehydrogenase [Roseibacterium sp. SDUM158017]
MSVAAFGFATAGAIRFGRGTLAEAAPSALARARRILVVRSASVAAADDLVRALGAGGDVLEIVARGEPDLPGILAGCETARPFAPEMIVAIGGGAVIDHGKALAALLPAPHGPLRYLEVVGEGRPLDTAPLPVIAIPTTAGTGSEVTRNAVIQIPDAARKVSLRDPRLYPALAIVDPSLAASCPRHVALASGLDAVTQVVEPFVSRRANPFTDALCRDAIPRGLSALRRIMDAPDDGAWDDMALTSLAGGIALANAGLGAVHDFAGVIGGLTGAAHGAICGALLPHVLRANRRAAGPDTPGGERLDWVLDRIGEEFESLDAFQEWSAAHGLQGLADQGLGAADHARVAQEAKASSSYSANPVDLDDASLRAILAEA